jgi:hypothetical protein
VHIERRIGRWIEIQTIGVYTGEMGICRVWLDIAERGISVH